MIFASALTVPAAFAQNQTEAAESCPREYSMVDGVCTVDEVKKYKIASILLEQYNEHQESSGSGASGASGSSGAAEQLVVIDILFKGDDCSLPENLGIVRKGPCDTYYENAQMAVLIPVANMYDVAALDQVAGIYPDAEAHPGELPEPASSVDDEPAIPDLDTTEPSSPAAHENIPYIALVGTAAAVAAVAATLYTKQRRRIEA
ncbi:MAG: hypothetical protein OXP12_06850 [Thaumarchaeota archaeon]|nr:hypothetical protein [Nitrososphaerota archaeon]